MFNTTRVLTNDFLDVQEDFIDMDALQIIVSIFVFVLYPVLSFAGVVTNTLNIKTFLALGLSDGVSISLISLSVSDLCWCSAAFTVGVSSILTEMEAKYQIILPINPFAVTIFSANVGLTFYAMTVMSTTFLAVARCVCVAYPLRFKFLFARSRSIAFHAIFAVFAIACYSPLLSQMGTKTRFDSTVNATRSVLWFSDIREDVKEIVYLFYGTVVSFTSQVLILVCVIVMADSLQSSGKFRHENKATVTEAGDAISKETEYKLCGKELQVVKQVVLISIIYMVCSVPKMCTSAYNLTDPEFSLVGKFKDIYRVMQYVSNVFEVINSTSTFFIYYSFNSKFRAKF